MRQDLAYILATGYVALSLLLAGFYLRTSEFKLRPLVWLSYISYPRSAAPACTLSNLQTLSDDAVCSVYQKYTPADQHIPGTCVSIQQ